MAKNCLCVHVAADQGRRPPFPFPVCPRVRLAWPTWQGCCRDRRRVLPTFNPLLKTGGRVRQHSSLFSCPRGLQRSLCPAGQRVPPDSGRQVKLGPGEGRDPGPLRSRGGQRRARCCPELLNDLSQPFGEMQVGSDGEVALKRQGGGWLAGGAERPSSMGPDGRGPTYQVAPDGLLGEVHAFGEGDLDPFRGLLCKEEEGALLVLLIAESSVQVFASTKRASPRPPFCSPPTHPPKGSSSLPPQSCPLPRAYH